MLLTRLTALTCLCVLCLGACRGLNAADDDIDKMDKEIKGLEELDKKQDELDRKQEEFQRKQEQRDQKAANAGEAADKLASKREKEKERKLDSAEQKRLAQICADLLTGLPLDAKVTPSATVKKILGSNYTVELRDGNHPIDLQKLRAAVSSKNWLDALSILKGEKLTAYPEDTDGILDQELFRHEFTIVVLTKADLSKTVAISISEVMPSLGTDPFKGNDSIIDGRKVQFTIGQEGESLHTWTKHPDGKGWYCTWQPEEGELIIVPIPKGDNQAKTLIDYKLSQCGPDISSEERGLIPRLQKKLTLGEVSKQEAEKELANACLERYQAQRKAALSW